MRVSTKMRCYSAYVLPVLLFGSEFWALRKQQIDHLERVHSSCLRQILNVRLTDRHTLVSIRSMCGTVPLADHIMAARMRWLGHVCRMDEGRIPHCALFSTLHTDNIGLAPKRRPGGQFKRWEACVHQDLKQLGISVDDPSQLDAMCAVRSAWRQRVYRITHPHALHLPYERQSRVRQDTVLPFAC